MRRHAVLAGLLTLAIGLVPAGAAAAAATPAPGLLVRTDLPKRFLSVVPPTAVPDPSVLTTDAATCTQTLQPVTAATGGWLVQFTPGGAPNALPSVTELVIVYTDAAAARASFVTRAASHAARLKCGTVALVPTGSSTPTTSAVYKKVSFRAVGRSRFAERSLTAGTTTPYTSVTFLSGAYVVGLTFSGGPHALRSSVTGSLAVRAAHRLTSPSAGP